MATLPGKLTAAVLTRLEDLAESRIARGWLGGWKDERTAQIRTYWLTGAAFVLIYVAVERLTLVYQLDGLGITLWGPAAGFSLVLLLRWGLSYAPFIFIASLIADFAVYTGPRGVFAPAGTSLVLAGGLCALTLALRKFWRFGPESPRLTDVVALLVIVPIGTLLIAVLYCAVLYAAGLITPWRLVIAARNFWIGDTLGMITLTAAAPAAFSLTSRSWQTISRSQVIDIVVFASTLCAAFWLIFAVASSYEHEFFYFLFLPIIWIAIRAGYAAASIALLVTHLLLLTIATTLGFVAYDFIAFQLLMLALTTTGLLLGAVISERWASEEQIRRQQADLARAGRQATVGAVGTALAHEVSQPLSSATNYLYAAHRLLRRHHGDSGPVAEALAKAELEARRAREALERVRDYVSTGRVEVVSIDLEAAVRKIAALLRRDAVGRQVVLEVSSTPHLPAVRGDAVQLEQLLLNLITNAVEAACLRHDDRPRVSIHLRQRVERIVVEIQDNGPGIDAEIADRLFEPFETTKPRGMGLGLAVSRQIVEAHSGRLSWQPAKPQGTLFVVELLIDGPPRNAA
jgi:signal transduction histidine kinase